MTATPTIQFVTNTMPGNFSLDGAIIQELSPQQGLPQGPNTGLIAVVGTATDGKVGVPMYGSVENDLYAACGRDTTTKRSLVRESLSAMPDCKNFIFLRVGDGTQTEATLVILDTASPTAGHVLVLTAINPGTNANGATARIDLQSGTVTNAPVYVITVTYPNGQTQTWKNIVGYSTANGPYAAATFQANAIAAINGTVKGSTASPYFIASAGVSTTAVATKTVFQASGGTNGDTTITDSTLIGTDNGAASTGMYALRGLLAGGQVILADLQDPTLFATVAEFVLEENCTSWETFASGTDTPTAVANKATNSMSNDGMSVVMDWLDVNDVFQGEQILVSPIGKAAGIVASVPPYQYVGNQPENGTTGVTSTERMQLGALPMSEGALREQNGINWIGKTPNGVMGLYHGLTSSGRQLNEIRMLKYLSVLVGGVMARFVGKMLETTLPIAQADENDPRIQCSSALRTLFTPMLTPGNRQISAAQVIINDSNNPAAKMQQGFLVAAVLVTSLTGVQFAVGLVQVSNTLQLAATTLSGS